MKVFVYDKTTSKKIAVIKAIEKIFCEGRYITFIDANGNSYKFDCRKVKTVSYQN